MYLSIRMKNFLFFLIEIIKIYEKYRRYRCDLSQKWHNKKRRNNFIRRILFYCFISFITWFAIVILYELKIISIETLALLYLWIFSVILNKAFNIIFNYFFKLFHKILGHYVNWLQKAETDFLIMGQHYLFHVIRVIFVVDFGEFMFKHIFYESVGLIRLAVYLWQADNGITRVMMFESLLWGQPYLIYLMFLMPLFTLVGIMVLSSLTFLLIKYTLFPKKYKKN